MPRADGPTSRSGKSGVQTLVASGAGGAAAYDIVSSRDTLYVTGFFGGTDVGVGGLGSFQSIGELADAFVLALDPSTGSPRSGFSGDGWETYAGSSMDGGYDLATHQGSVFVLGSTTSADGGVGGTGSFDATGFGGFLLELEGTSVVAP